MDWNLLAGDIVMVSGKEQWDKLLPPEFLYPSPFATGKREEIIGLAEKIGPLLPAKMGEPIEEIIKEDALLWQQAASDLAFAIKCIGVVDGRAKVNVLDSDIFISVALREKKDQLFRVTRPWLGGMHKGYSEHLGSSAHTFSPEAMYEETPDEYWNSFWLKKSYGKSEVQCLVVDLRIEDIKPTHSEYYHLRPSLFWKFSKEDCLKMISETFRAMTSWYTRGIRFDWSTPSYRSKEAMDELHTKIFAPVFRNPLERFWFDLSQDASRGKLGVCARCGRYFSAENERKDKKKYCSKDCQERAKSARQYRRKKALK
ncbi:MAG TPA: hypothetical protein H9877_00245 [Candidatus Gordonibacter avicola]|nr:hypothetical protein [Candidatus Gordonibacter avicola]